MWIGRRARLATLVLGALLATAGAACGGAGGAPAGGAPTARVLLSWLPQAEHGGWLQASATGLDVKAGAKFRLIPGGPQVQPIPQVASGSADFGIVDADYIVVAQSQGIPVVAVYAAFNVNPVCLMYHPGTGIATIADVNGHTVAVVPGWAGWEWIKKRYKLDHTRDVVYNGTVSQFQQDPGLVSTCYVTNAPYLAKQAGVSAGILRVPDLGYNSYANVLFTTEKMIQQNPKLVAAVVAATRAGWQSYLSDPRAGNQLLRTMEPSTDMGLASYTVTAMKPLVGPDPGAMTAERWRMTSSQLLEVGQIKQQVDPTRLFTTRFLP